MADALEKTSAAAKSIDLSRFERGEQLPGTYRVQIWLNHEYVRTDNISFVAINGLGLAPELNRTILAQLGVRVSAFSKLAELPDSTIITNPGDFIPDAKASLDFDRQRLDISIPQSALENHARGQVDPARWDQGISALLLNYSFNGSRNWTKQGGTDDQFYLNLQSGVNLGPWRLRNYSTAIKSGGKHNVSSVSTVLSRDIQFLKGQFQVGESSTPGEIFDSFLFRGMQFYSDDTMLPESMRGFAPIIRGIARTNAMVTVKQNGYTVYQTYVAPGSFAIRDLYPTSSSGDLEVTVKEADGSEQRFVQPFSAVPVMLREGRLKYALSGGEYRTSKKGAQTPTFGMGTLAYGVSSRLTLYAGALGAENYLSGVVGAGVSFGELGSISADATLAESKLQDGKTTRQQGQSYRLQYSKTVTTTDTTVTLASYRYSTQGFYTFQEVNDYSSQRYNKRSRLQLNLSQSLSSWGSFYISAYQQDYWRRTGYERSISTGINTSISDISYSLGYTYSETPGYEKKDQILAFSMQVPLSKWLPQSWVSYSVNAQKNGPETHQVGLSGTALADNNLSYSLQQGYASSGGEARSSVSGTYKGGYGTLSAGYNAGRDNRQFNFGLQGGVIAHKHGVTFSQPLGDTVALVEAPGASGLKVRNNPGVKTDWRGYAVVPYVSAYQENAVGIDTRSLGTETDIAESVVTVVPTRGAVVRASYKVATGYRALVKLLFNHKPVPFGAMVRVKNSDLMSIVGNEGEVFLSGLNSSDAISVSWGQTSCQAKITFSPRPDVIQHATATCR
ncbi:fimbrial biogenesis outer membrane usher protein [Pantoea sp. ACRSH]|uniref:fimbria/pilus outer membrane usher protein n=1 Tax=unclassified Pantoea TaxID=2630326 RepID=UPI001EF4B54C|nr:MULTISPECIES: fimbria/pilus outer membrane usher protein [unclassified Pantoea]MCG7365052.1 fimbrial biogenesis outer membrane usher protein [Pantoea sp. ACRSH]MCG7395072.1 fimbrial biogenesis outer membrane usher protein [Pantoea sp. ACRSC]